MRRRTKAREFALQILYQMDITGDEAAISLDNFWQSDPDTDIEDEVKKFTALLVKGVADNLKSIDTRIVQYSTNWQLKRMAVVDRNILRMGAFELLFRSDIPVKVSINEAVDLAKRFSGVEAGKFVNGVLDKIRLEKDK